MKLCDAIMSPAARKMKTRRDSLFPRHLLYITAATAVAIVLAFATLPFLPPHRAAGPPVDATLLGSTFLFVPVYVVIAVGLIFGSIYLFKWIMDYDPDEPSNYQPGA